MSLTNDLVSKFAKLVTTNVPGQNETTVKGTIKEIDGVKYAQFDGSEMLTPVSSTATISDGDRVNILLKNHSAMVTGNATDPSASSWKVGLLDGKFNNLAAKNIDVDNLTAEVAKISTLKAEDAIIQNIQATAITADYIEAAVAEIGYIKTNELSAEVAKISTLTADDAIIKNIQSTAINADYIRTAVADVGYITADDAVIKGKLDANMANIDHANIDKSQIGLLFLEMGLIDNATIVDGHITGHLDAVEVNANKITAGTLTVDRLLLKDESGNYKMAMLNENGELITTTINGSVITERTINASHIVAESITGNEIAAETITGDKLVAKSITASKIDVDNLFAQELVVNGLFRSANYTEYYWKGEMYCNTGMKIDMSMSEPSIKTPNFRVVDGVMYATNGIIGPFRMTTDKFIYEKHDVDSGTYGISMAGDKINDAQTICTVSGFDLNTNGYIIYKSDGAYNYEGIRAVDGNPDEYKRNVTYAADGIFFETFYQEAWNGENTHTPSVVHATSSIEFYQIENGLKHCVNFKTDFVYMNGQFSITSGKQDKIYPDQQDIVINGTGARDYGALPGIGFHIPNVCYSTLKYYPDDSFRFVNSGATGYVGVHASSFYENDVALSSKYLQLSGGTLTGKIERAGGGSWASDIDQVAVMGTSHGQAGGQSYNVVVGQLTNNGRWTIGNLSGAEELYFRYTPNSGSATNTLIPTTGGTLALTSQIPTNNNQLANGAGYITASGSCNYATSAGSSNKLATTRYIFNRPFDGTGNVEGQGLFYGSYTNPSNRYAYSGLQIRENGLVLNSQTDIGYAPSIGFHWGNSNGGTLSMCTDGIFYFRKIDGTSRATIDANVNGNVNGTATGNAPSSATPQASAYTAPTSANGNTTTGYILFPNIRMAIQWSTHTWVGPLTRAWNALYLEAQSSGITPPDWPVAFTSEPIVTASARNWSGGACGVLKSGNVTPPTGKPTSRTSPGTWDIWRSGSLSTSAAYTVTVIGIGKY